MQRENLRKVEYSYAKPSDEDMVRALGTAGGQGMFHQQTQIRKGYFHHWALDGYLVTDNKSGNVYVKHITTALIENEQGNIERVRPDCVTFKS